MSGRCDSALSQGTLSDYWLGDLPDEDEARVEDHLIGCDACGQELQWVIDLAAATRRLARRGLLRVVVGSAFLDRLAGEGLRLRQYRVQPGGSVDCTVTPEDDLVVARLVAPFDRTGRLDLVMCDAGGREQARIPDIAIDPSCGEAILTEPIDALRRLPVATLRFRIVAVEAGGERPLGEYTFHHTPHPQP